MTLLFAHDHKFIASGDGRVLSPGKFPYGLWERYLEVFDDIVVVARQESSEKQGRLERYNLSSGPGVSFSFVPSLTNPKSLVWARRRARASMRAIMKNVAAVVARLPSETGLLAISCARELGIPWMVELVGCPADAMRYHGSLRGLLYAPLSRERVRKAVRDAPFVVYVTDAYLQSLYPSDGFSVACSNVEVVIDQATYARRAARIISRRDPLVIGTIAPLGVKYKGIEVAIDAIDSIADDYPRVHYAVLGGGEVERYEQIVQRKGLESRVHFCGVLPAGDEVNAWLDGVDIYVQPSLTEGLPRSLIEAMARGCPALGSKAGGIPELLESAFLHDPGDVKGLAKGLRHLLDDLTIQGSAAKDNFQTASKFSADKIQKRRAHILRKLADTGRSRVGT